MSCPQEPAAEDVEYKCLAQGTNPDGNCIYSFWMPKDTTPHNADRCETCVTIEGVISRLQTLVCWEPWWETEGRAGQPHRAAWELDGLKGKKEGEENEEDEEEAAFGDGMTSKERTEFRRKMEHHFLSTQGRGVTEEEALAGGVSHHVFYSSSSTLVDEEWRGVMVDDEKQVEISATEVERLDENCVS